LQVKGVRYRHIVTAVKLRLLTNQIFQSSRNNFSIKYDLTKFKMVAGRRFVLEL